jgi:hypothetical protein
VKNARRIRKKKKRKEERKVFLEKIALAENSGTLGNKFFSHARESFSEQLCTTVELLLKQKTSGLADGIEEPQSEAGSNTENTLARAHAHAQGHTEAGTRELKDVGRPVGCATGVSRVGRGDLEMLLGLVGVKNKGLESGEGAKGALELRRLALVLQVVAPHLVELAALGAGVAEHVLTDVSLAICCKQKSNAEALVMGCCYLLLCFTFVFYLFLFLFIRLLGCLLDCLFCFVWLTDCFFDCLLV